MVPSLGGEGRVAGCHLGRETYSGPRWCRDSNSLARHGKVECFEEFLDNIFGPLFEVGPTVFWPRARGPTAAG
jgi:hypothetical protein